MNFTSLVVHGLSALSVYSQIIGVRFLIGSLLLGCLLLAGVLGVIRWRVVHPGDSVWPLLLMMLVLILLLQAAVSGVVFVFLVLAGRQTATFLPLRDYRWFVRGEVDVWTNPAASR
jgi:hypothetical protein